MKCDLSSSRRFICGELRELRQFCIGGCAAACQRELPCRCRIIRRGYLGPTPLDGGPEFGVGEGKLQAAQQVGK